MKPETFSAMKTIEAVDLSTLTNEDFLRASSPEGKAEIQQDGKITIIDLLWLPAAQLQKMLDREAKSGFLQGVVQRRSFRPRLYPPSGLGFRV